MIEEYIAALQKTQAFINLVMELDPELDREELELKALCVLFEQWVEKLDEDRDFASFYNYRDIDSTRQE